MRHRKELSLETRQRRVREAWERVIENEPCVSEERLLGLIAEETQEDYADVAALKAWADPDITGKSR